jgi:hypothetical protein
MSIYFWFLVLFILIVHTHKIYNSKYGAYADYIKFMKLSFIMLAFVTVIAVYTNDISPVPACIYMFLIGSRVHAVF